MNNLTAEQVLFMHARLITETGGEHGILGLELLQSAVACPYATFIWQGLYPNLFLKTASLLESLVGNYAFVDGNKRRAITCAGLFFRSQRLPFESKYPAIRGIYVRMRAALGFLGSYSLVA